jgi:hypothetical protein
MFQLTGDARPFSSSYWPMSQNGILARWAGGGNPSPAEKYGQLYLSPNEQRQMYDYIERNQGRRVRGIKSWFGICQGWAASAVAEKTPRHAISVGRVNGNLQPCGRNNRSGCVTFFPGDITALLAAAYAESDSRFIGERCDTSVARFRYDESGRVVQPNCRSNAGTLFLVATNFIKRNRGFVLAVTNNAEIWNQPALGYRIGAYKKVSAQQAADLVGSRRGSYPWNSSATDFRYVVMTVTWANEASPTISTPPPLATAGKTYQFVLELNGNGSVIGGEWVGRSKVDHPPFFWAPVSPGDENPQLEYRNVKALLDMSRN